MNSEDRAAIRARLAAATPGPWRIARSRGGVPWIDAGEYDEVLAPADVDCMAYCYGGTSRIEMSDADAEFIAHARTDVADLLDALDEAERTLEQILTHYAVTVDGEWGKCRTPKHPGWDTFFAEFKATELSGLDEKPWWADDDYEEDA